MEMPRQLRSAADRQEDVTITTRESDEGSEIIVDFGPGVEATLDRVGETAIVVAGDRQLEFDVPEDAREVTTNDGILIIKG
ncbi:hypothetical protein [Halorarum salinum]|uniref:Hsp20/alpha crystallin family protein n=1 Tax=Halorarum salinum TaxID=2743089 RepID=A0A7D5LCI8_9EURY|nr:hypothetical protein [Halobaculum salinum]QLG62795.1 hypothetical protein HUG12_14095 [Halobaculum salinum]